MSERLSTHARDARKTATPPSLSSRLLLGTGRAPVQPKLVVNPPGDRYEQEADRAADEVLRMSESSLRTRGAQGIEATREGQSVQMRAEGSWAHTTQQTVRGNLTPLVIQRQSEPLEEEEKDDERKIEVVQAKGATGVPGEISPEAASGVEAARGGGHALPAAERAFFEPRFGYDFSSVRIHTGAQAAESARSLGALAYTTGHDVVFGAGRYEPGTSAGRLLLAHELSHVVQQNPSGRAPARALIQRAPDEPRTIKRVDIYKGGVIRVTLSDDSVVKLRLNMRESKMPADTYRGIHKLGELIDSIMVNRELKPGEKVTWRFIHDPKSPLKWTEVPDCEYELVVHSTIEPSETAGGKKEGQGEKGAADKGTGEGADTGGGKKEGEGGAGEGKKEGDEGAGTTPGEGKGDGTTPGSQIPEADRKKIEEFYRSLKTGGVNTQPVSDEELAEVLSSMSSSEQDDFERYIKESAGQSGEAFDLKKGMEFYKNLSPSDRELLRANLALRTPGAQGVTELPEKVKLNLTASAEKTTEASAVVGGLNEGLKKASESITDDQLSELKKIHNKVAPEVFDRENLEPIDLTKLPFFTEMMMFEGMLAGASTKSPQIEQTAKELTASIGEIREYVLTEIAWMAGEMALSWVISALLAPASGGASVAVAAGRAILLLERLNNLRKFLDRVYQVYSTYQRIEQLFTTITKLEAAYAKYQVFKARYDDYIAKLEALQAQLETSEDDTIVDQIETLEDALLEELQAQLESGSGIGGLLDNFYIPEDATEEDLREIIYNMPRGLEALEELVSFYKPGMGASDLEYTKTLAFKGLRVGILLYPFVGYLAAMVSNELSSLLQEKTIGERLLGFLARASSGRKKRLLPGRDVSKKKLKGVKKKRPKTGDEEETTTPGQKKKKKKEEEGEEGGVATKKKAADEEGVAKKKKPDEEEGAAKKKGEGEEPTTKKKKEGEEEEQDPKKKAEAEAAAREDAEWAQVKLKVSQLAADNPNGATKEDLLVDARKIRAKHKAVANAPSVHEVTGEGRWRVKIERAGLSKTDEATVNVLMSVRTRWSKGRSAVEAAVEARTADQSDKSSIESLIAGFKDKYEFQILRVGNRTDKKQGLAVFGKMGSQNEAVIAEIDNVSQLHTGESNDPIPVHWYKHTGNYPSKLKVNNTGPNKVKGPDGADANIIPMNAKSTIVDKATGSVQATIGIDMSNLIKVGDALYRKSTPRSNTMQKNFRDTLQSVGYDWTGRDADHVKDLAFEGKDAFENLWPLDKDVNRWAYTGKWYINYGIEYRDSADPRKSKTGTLYNLAGKWFTVIGFRTKPLVLGGKG